MYMELKKAYNSLIVNYSLSKGYHKDYVSFVVKGLLTVIIVSLLYSITFSIMKFYWGSFAMGLTAIILLGCLIGFKIKLKISIIAHSYILICLCSLIVCILKTGGITSPILPWLICIPFFASLIVRTAELWIWVGLTAFSISTLSLSFINGWTPINLIANNEYLNVLFVVLNIGLIITLGSLAYINWTYIYKKKNKRIKKDVIYIEEDEIDFFILEWNFLKSKLDGKFSKVLKTIDGLHFLTDHEKKYALIKHFGLDAELLSNKMSVTKRTIETNLYRVKLKMKKNNVDPNILLKKS